MHNLMLPWHLTNRNIGRGMLVMPLRFCRKGSSFKQLPWNHETIFMLKLKALLVFGISTGQALKSSSHYYLCSGHSVVIMKEVFFPM
jgi:hypothetical protein